jgi:hypothetical protein
MTVRRFATIVSVALVASLGASGSAVAAAPPSSEYDALPVCRAPAPGHASCLALALAPHTDAARLRVHPRGVVRATTIGTASPEACARAYPACLTPTDLNDAYFPGEKPEAPTSAPQTIALVDAYDDPDIASDLGVYDKEFGLPSCTEANGCFKQVNQNGESGRPPVTHSEAEAEEAEGWALETSTDVEAAHAVCQTCRIVLVEAENSAYPNLIAAERTATGAFAATEVSNSWGGSEAELTENEIAAFDHPGTVITASAGDDGYLNWTQWEGEPLQFDEPAFPASSPDVVAVGGTRLTLSGAGAWEGERVWNNGSEGASGGGCSLRFAAQLWQRAVANWPAVGCEARRAVADVAADADPDSGVAVYDSVPYPYEAKKTAVLKWVPIGGTSLASPIVAAMFALAGGAHGVAYPAQTLYSHLGSSLLHDVTSGGNGDCDDEYTTCGGSMKPLSPFDCGQGALICNATVGYDGASGVGTPNGIGAFTPSGEGQGSGKPESKGGTGSGEGGTKGTGETGKGESGSGEAGKGEGGGGLTTTGGEGAPTTTAIVAGGAPETGDLTGGASQDSSTSSTTNTGASHPAASAARITALALTANAIAALRHGRPAIARLAFAFTISARARVRVTLAREVRVGAHRRWAPQPGAFTLAAGHGGNRFRMRGLVALPAGRYRVTLAPSGGPARTLTFTIGRPPRP